MEELFASIKENIVEYINNSSQSIRENTYKCPEISDDLLFDDKKELYKIFDNAIIPESYTNSILDFNSNPNNRHHLLPNNLPVWYASFIKVLDEIFMEKLPDVTYKLVELPCVCISIDNMHRHTLKPIDKNFIYTNYSFYICINSYLVNNSENYFYAGGFLHLSKVSMNNIFKFIHTYNAVNINFDIVLPHCNMVYQFNIKKENSSSTLLYGVRNIEMDEYILLNSFNHYINNPTVANITGIHSYIATINGYKLGQNNPVLFDAFMNKLYPDYEKRIENYKQVYNKYFEPTNTNYTQHHMLNDFNGLKNYVNKILAVNSSITHYNFPEIYMHYINTLAEFNKPPFYNKLDFIKFNDYKLDTISLIFTLPHGE